MTRRIASATFFVGLTASMFLSIVLFGVAGIGFADTPMAVRILVWLLILSPFVALIIRSTLRQAIIRDFALGISMIVITAIYLITVFSIAA